MRCIVAAGCRSQISGVGNRMTSDDACDWQSTHRVQLCAGWPGFCCAGCVPAWARQIGTLPTGPAPLAGSTSEIVAKRRMIWHQTAMSEAANPGLFNALFFGGMGRVSLKCHTPTQTAL